MGRRGYLLLVGLPVYAFVLSLLALGASTIIFEPLQGWVTCANAVFHPDFEQLIEMFSEQFYWFYFGGPAVLVAVTQILFLLPVDRRLPPRSDKPKSLLLSFAMAGLVAAGLATGLFLAAVAAIRLLFDGDQDFVADDASTWFLWIALPMAISWIGWSLLIASFAKKQRQPGVLLRLIKWLLAGTLVEVLVVLPVDIMIRRKVNCYCGSATAHSLGLAAWATLWLAGPGIVLAVMSKRRRFLNDMNCEACGYAKGPSPGERCPECGFGWKPKS